MGVLKPVAIIVSASYENDERRPWIEAAHEKAVEVFSGVEPTAWMQGGELAQLISPIIDGVANSVRSFFIAWDGSKEGWPEDMAGDKAREEFVGWLREQRYDDGSSPLAWVEVQYGGDYGAKVLAHSREKQRVA